MLRLVGEVGSVDLVDGVGVGCLVVLVVGVVVGLVVGVVVELVAGVVVDCVVVVFSSAIDVFGVV